MQGRVGFVAGGSGHISDNIDDGVGREMGGGVVGILTTEFGGEEERKIVLRLMLEMSER